MENAVLLWPIRCYTCGNIFPEKVIELYLKNETPLGELFEDVCCMQQIKSPSTIFCEPEKTETREKEKSGRKSQKKILVLEDEEKEDVERRHNFLRGLYQDKVPPKMAIPGFIRDGYDYPKLVGNEIENVEYETLMVSGTEVKIPRLIGTYYAE